MTQNQSLSILLSLTNITLGSHRVALNEPFQGKSSGIHELTVWKFCCLNANAAEEARFTPLFVIKKTNVLYK